MVKISEHEVYLRKLKLKQSAGDPEQAPLFKTCSFVLSFPDLACSCKHFKDGFCLHNKYCSAQRVWKL
jgi:hypothetical protein